MITLVSSLLGLGPTLMHRTVPVQLHLELEVNLLVRNVVEREMVQMKPPCVKCIPTALQMLISCMRSIIFLPVFCTPICRTFNSLTLATVERSYFLRIVSNSRVPALRGFWNLEKPRFLKLL